MTVKERAIEALKSLPEDADYEAIAEKIDFIRSVDKGLQEADEGKLLTAEEFRRRLQRWLSD
jgi:hypothetical protein